LVKKYLTNRDLEGRLMADKLNYFCNSCNIKCDSSHRAIFKHHNVIRITKRNYKLKANHKEGF